MREPAAGLQGGLDEHDFQRPLALTQQMNGRARARETAANDQDVGPCSPASCRLGECVNHVHRAAAVLAFDSG